MFRLRAARREDALNIFELSNDPLVRQNSISTGQIKWEEHLKWLKAMLANPDALFFIIEAIEDASFMGQARLVNKGDIWEISISISAAHRGKKLAAKVLGEAIRACPGARFRAEVLRSNAASARAFASLGFREKDSICRDGRIFQVLELEK